MRMDRKRIRACGDLHFPHQAKKKEKKKRGKRMNKCGFSTMVWVSNCSEHVLHV